MLGLQHDALRVYIQARPCEQVDIIPKLPANFQLDSLCERPLTFGMCTYQLECIRINGLSVVHNSS